MAVVIPLPQRMFRAWGNRHRTQPVYRCWRGHRKPCMACKWSGSLSMHTWHRIALKSSCLRTAVTLARQSHRSCTGFFLGGSHCGRNVFSPISSATDITKAADIHAPHNPVNRFGSRKSIRLISSWVVWWHCKSISIICNIQIIFFK